MFSSQDHSPCHPCFTASLPPPCSLALPLYVCPIPAHNPQHLAPPIISLLPLPIFSYFSTANACQAASYKVRGNSNHSQLLVWTLGHQTCPAFWVFVWFVQYPMNCCSGSKSFLVSLEQKALQEGGIRTGLLPFFLHLLLAHPLESDANSGLAGCTLRRRCQKLSLESTEAQQDS